LAFWQPPSEPLDPSLVWRELAQGREVLVASQHRKGDFGIKKYFAGEVLVPYYFTG
jgi:hypothetical protein